MRGSNLTRRDFLRAAGIGAAGLSLGGKISLAAAPSPSRAVASRPPNVLFICTDQQHAGMLSCAGNPWVKTPHLDSLAASGARFECAYSANPVCVPSRFSMFTGCMPSAIGMEFNTDQKIPVPENILRHAMGNVFRSAGYRTVYGGKAHLNMAGGKVDNLAAYGFDEVLTKDPYGELAEKSAAFLRQEQDKPFLLVTSFMNPHDICYMALRAYAEAQKASATTLPAAVAGAGKGRGAGSAGSAGGAGTAMLSKTYNMPALAEAVKLPPGVSREEFFARYCPPLPGNYEIPQNELDIVADPFRYYVRRHWTDEDWRLHRWAYARLTEMVDVQIGTVLQALRQGGLEENTVVVFVSDHGDQDASHRLEHKADLYEEATRVPFIVSYKGHTQGGLVDRQHLVSSGLDLIPTLCDFAGIPCPAELRGRSVRPLAEGRSVDQWRDHLVVENRIARLVHSGRWKYMVGNGDKLAATQKAGQEPDVPPQNPLVREMLIDLKTDPGEMNNLALNPAYTEELRRGRSLLRQWYQEQGLVLDPGYVVNS